ncbi:MAG TPA: hypothetical protein PLC52_04230 [Anaerolineales bacterium]|nr:hypothetical protein [Anaerolineales bacterium]HRQ92058.1 hypothetical protein [Anaerolineales bacterium]
MPQRPLPNDLILVCILPNPRDLDIARTLGWYRIPLVSGPQIIAADHLAFYQPASFGSRKWCIEYTAPLNGYEMVLRKDLFKDEPDHPRGMNEYFKIQIGSLYSLPRPLPAGEWKRITFFYTTGDLLLGAETIADLQVPSEQRGELYRSIREKAVTEQGYDTRTTPALPVDLDLLALFAIRESGEMFFGSGGGDA